MLEYDRVLDLYPNHDPIDFDIMVGEAASRNQRLWNDEGDIVYTDEMKKRVGRHKAFSTLGKAVAFVLPALVIWSALSLSDHATNIEPANIVAVEDE